MLSINEALKLLPPKKRAWFEYKFGLTLFRDFSGWTDEDFMENISRTKTLVLYKQWERTPEYNCLVNLLLYARSTRDLLEVYDTVSEKAKSGDEKNVKLLLELQKQIRVNAKESSKLLTGEENKAEEEDGLII